MVNEPSGFEPLKFFCILDNFHLQWILAVCIHYILATFYIQWDLCCLYTLYFGHLSSLIGPCCMYTPYFGQLLFSIGRYLYTLYFGHLSYSMRTLLFVYPIFWTTSIFSEDFAVCIHYILDNFHLQWRLCCLYTLHFSHLLSLMCPCCLYTHCFEQLSFLMRSLMFTMKSWLFVYTIF